MSLEATEESAWPIRAQLHSSNSLKKLRALFDDPLFQREGRGIRPTVKAVDIAAEIGPAIDRIQNVLS